MTGVHTSLMPSGIGERQSSPVWSWDQWLPKP